jgi:hypothetical protein
MTSDGRWHLVAMAGFLAMLLFAASLAAGMWIAHSLGGPVWVGWLAGAVIGFLCSRRLLRSVLNQQLG